MGGQVDPEKLKAYFPAVPPLLGSWGALEMAEGRQGPPGLAALTL